MNRARTSDHVDGAPGTTREHPARETARARAQSAPMARAQMGRRMNHSCTLGPASAAKRTPKGTPKDMPRALIQKMSTGLDMNQPS